MHIGRMISQMDPYWLACRSSGPAQSVRFVASALEQSGSIKRRSGSTFTKEVLSNTADTPSSNRGWRTVYCVITPFCEPQIVSVQWVFTQESRRIRERGTSFSTTARFGLRYLPWQDYRKSQSDRNLLLPTLFSSLTSLRGILCWSPSGGSPKRLL